jgi:hypothetical protein
VARGPEPPPALPGPAADTPLPETLASLEEELERPEDLAVIEMLEWLEALGEIDGSGRG